jgi:CDP-diacylglycerol--serine O-phosphatidyltransferase
MRAPLHDLHVSNLLTYTSLVLALGAIAFARGPDGGPIAGALLAAAALADTFDGRFARQFRRTERQAAAGREIDSLVDAVAFGVVPIVVLHALTAGQVGARPWLWWMAACAYLLATVTRLGFYNVEKDDQQFVGLPTPAVALVWSTCLFWPMPAWFVAALLVVLGAGMIAPIPIGRPRGAFLAAFACWAVGLVAAHTARLI